jgi:hypothetical protein
MEGSMSRRVLVVITAGVAVVGIARAALGLECLNLHNRTLPIGEGQYIIKSSGDSHYSNAYNDGGDQLNTPWKHIVGALNQTTGIFATTFAAHLQDEATNDGALICVWVRVRASNVEGTESVACSTDDTGLDDRDASFFDHWWESFCQDTGAMQGCSGNACLYNGMRAIRHPDDIGGTMGWKEWWSVYTDTTYDSNSPSTTDCGCFRVRKSTDCTLN